MAQRKPRNPADDPALKPWIRTAADLVAIAEGCWFDPTAAARVCSFFETFLCHSKGQFAEARFLLEPWQRDFLSRLYGWKRADGTRRFREAYLEVPKKNGKSTLLSGIVLYAIFEEPAAEVYLGAVDRSQAGIIFDEAARMVKASKTLRKRLRVLKSKRTIVYDKLDSKIVAMSADAPSKDGVSSSCTVLDETHRHKKRDLYEVMLYAGEARSQPLLINITTAGYDRESLCWELHEKAAAIIKGDGLNVEFLGVIYAADLEKDDLDDPATWLKANPSMPAVLSIENFRKAHAEAKKIRRKWLAFLRLRLNIWTSSECGWISAESWTPLAVNLPPDFLAHRKCYVALDLSSRKDLTVLMLLFPYGKRKVHLVPIFFMPEDSVEPRSVIDKVPYDKWIAEGWMIPTPGAATDHESIRLKLKELAPIYRIQKVGVDPWNAQHLFNLLEEDGFDVVGIGQGFKSLSEPSKDFEARILEKTLSHDGNPVMTMCVENAVVETDAAENIKPSKKKSTKRIDGVVAAVMTLFLHNFNKPKPKPKVSFI